MQIAEKRCMNRLKIGEPCAFFLLYSIYMERCQLIVHLEDGQIKLSQAVKSR